MQRIEIWNAFSRSDTVEVVEILYLRDLIAEILFTRVVAGNTPAETMYEIVLPDPRYSLADQRAYDRRLNLSFSQLTQAGISTP